MSYQEKIDRAAVSAVLGVCQVSKFPQWGEDVHFFAHTVVQAVRESDRKIEREERRFTLIVVFCMALFLAGLILADKLKEHRKSSPHPAILWPSSTASGAEVDNHYDVAIYKEFGGDDTPWIQSAVCSIAYLSEVDQ